MLKATPSVFLASLLIACYHQQNKEVSIQLPVIATLPAPRTIEEIPVPEGFTRIKADAGSFNSWLRLLPLKNDKTVYLYNGEKKANQSAQYAVINISTGNKDLQQCADVVMRLRSEYLFAQKKYDSICFFDYSGKKYKWDGKGDRHLFPQYLETVFGWCGSASLEKQLRPVADFNTIQPGDVLIKGGFPGHAVIVADMAVNEKGERIFLLVQGYQPAQDMHVLVNPSAPSISPWYHVTDPDDTIYTPEWHFTKSQLRRW